MYLVFYNVRCFWKSFADLVEQASCLGFPCLLCSSLRIRQEVCSHQLGRNAQSLASATALKGLNSAVDDLDWSPEARFCRTLLCNNPCCFLLGRLFPALSSAKYHHACSKNCSQVCWSETWMGGLRHCSTITTYQSWHGCSELKYTRACWHL